MIKFACDDMVGRLAKWLRILGYDTSYDVSIPEAQFVKHAVRESRAVLTRDHGLKERWTIPSYLYLKSDITFEQLRQVIYELQLCISDDKILTICLECNKPLDEISKEEAKGKVPPYIYQTRDRFYICRNCGRLYWQGTHHDLVRGIIDRVLELKR